MLWIPLAAWIAAVVAAVVLLGFCAYELRWKVKRLRADLDRLQVVAVGLNELRGQVTEAQDRAAAAGLR